MDAILDLVSPEIATPRLLRIEEACLYPITRIGEEGQVEMEGVLGICGMVSEEVEDDHRSEFALLVRRIALALQDRRTQQQVFQTLQNLASQESLIQRMRAAGSYNKGTLLDEETMNDPELVQWVRDALNHYWGGPKLTENPLMRFRLVEKRLKENNDNHPNALRAVLREAIERVKPAGEKRFTSEWILYNILEMKFMEGRKVKEIAIRLAVSEADLYRKQRVAIEAVAQAILEMEDQLVKQNGTERG
jgi:hypothetical protein